MALTRPKIWGIDTNNTYFKDPVTVLHQGSTSANVDVGFVFNRANGLVSNVALYWSESGNTFVAGFTSNTGVNYGNILTTNYANVTVGSLLTLNNTGIVFNTGAGVSLNGSRGSVGQVLTADGIGGLTWSSGGFSGGYVLNSSVFGSNLVANAATISSSTTTGALVVVGGTGISGNLNAGTNNVSPTQHQLLSGSQFAPTVGTFLAGAHTVLNGAGGNYLAVGQYPGSGSGNQYGQWLQSGYPAVSGAVYYPIILNPLGGNVVVAPTTTSTSTTTGAFVVTGGVGVTGNINSGGYGAFSGVFNESSTTSGVFLGNTGTPGGITPRVGFFNGNSAQNWQIDQNNGTFRWFTPGISRMTLDGNTGQLSLPSTVQSASTTTGALVVSGGAGFSGSVYATTFYGNIGGGSTTANVFITGNVIPTGNGLYSLGGPSARFRNLYISGNTIDMDGATISTTAGQFSFISTGGTSASGSFSTVTASIVNAATIGNASAILTGGTLNISGTGSIGTLVATNFSTGNARVTGGYADNFPIGANTKSTGAFTTLTATGNVDLQNTVYGRGIYDNSVRVLSTSSGAGNLTISSGAVNLTATGPGATTTGSATAIPVITTDAYGRIAGITTAAVSSTLNISGNTGTGTVSLTSQTLNIAGGVGVTTTNNGQSVIINLPQTVATTSTPSFAGLTINGTITATTLNAGTIGNLNATLTGTLSTAAQTNVTSVGTLTGLTVSGNAIINNTLYGQGIYDNSVRVLSTTTGAGNLTISGTSVALTATGPGAASVGSSTAIPVITTDAYGRIAGTTTAVVVAPAGTLSGTTLASGVTSSSLTSLGTLTSLSLSGGISSTSSASFQGGVTVSSLTSNGFVSGTSATFSGRITGHSDLVTTTVYAATIGNASAVHTGGTLNISGAGSIGTLVATNFSTGNAIVTSLSVSGNLTVSGTTTTVHSTTVTIDDPIFTLGGDTVPTVDDNKDRGIEFRWHNGTAAKVGFFGFDDSTGYLTFIPDATNTLEVFSGTAGDIQATNFRGTLVGYKYVDNTNEITIANGFAGGGPLYLNYRGSTIATTQLRVCDGAAAGGLVDVAAKSFTSTVATGTAPMVVSSTTKVANLNVEQVDGYHADTANTISTIAVRDAAGNITATGFIGTHNGVAALTSGTITGTTTYNAGTVTTTGATVNGTLVATTVNAATIGNASAVHTGGTLNISGDGSIGTLVATNFSTGNARVTGGYADNFPIGANTKATGAFTTLTATGNVDLQNTVYGRGVYDNSVRVVSTSSGAGNLSISGTAVTLAATGPGATTTGSATAIPVITTDAYGRIAGITTTSVNVPSALGYTPPQLAMTGNVNSVLSTDSRAINYQPQDRNAGLYVDFKQNTTDGLADGGTYHGSLTFRPYGSTTDFSGGIAHQIAVTDNNNIWHRGGSAATWGNWVKVLDSANYSSYSTFTSNVVAAATTASTSTTTGALVVNGGVGVAGNIYIGGSGIFWSNSTPYSSGSAYSNANVATFLAAFGSNTISTTGAITVGNVTSNGTGSYFAGNVGINRSNNVYTKLITELATGSQLPTLGVGSGHFSVSNGSYGTLHGVTTGGDGWIQAQRTDSTATAYNLLLQPSGGAVGIGATSVSAGYRLYVNGAFAATTKSFLIDHPTKPGKQLRYGSLEGPENGVYVRGRLTGSNTIELPEYWTKLVDPESITVNLTPIGKHQNLYVVEADNQQVVIGNSNLFSKDVNCYYVVYGERCDVDKLDVEID